MGYNQRRGLQRGSKTKVSRIWNCSYNVTGIEEEIDSDGVPL